MITKVRERSSLLIVSRILGVFLFLAVFSWVIFSRNSSDPPASHSYSLVSADILPGNGGIGSTPGINGDVTPTPSTGATSTIPSSTSSSTGGTGTTNSATSTPPTSNLQITDLSLTSALVTPGSVILTIWNISRSLVDVVVVVALFVIAFANIFHLNINTYAAKKALPGLVIGVILSNASLLIVRFLVDVSTALSNLASEIGVNYVHGLSTFTAAYSGSSTAFLSASCNVSNPILNLVTCIFPISIGATAFTSIFAAGIVALGPLIILVLIILVIYYLFLVVAFAWALIKRVLLLYFLIAVAPIAFIAYGIPSFQKYFPMWWNNFLRYLFLFPIILFGMSLTVILAAITFQGNPLTYIKAVSTGDWGVLFGLIMVFLAANLVLNLPKIITKGTVMALDSLDSFKKLTQALPGIAAGAQDLHNRVTPAYQRWQGEKQINSQLALLRSRGANARTIANTQTFMRQNLADKIKETTTNRDKRYNTVRGVSHIMANPKVISDAWQERVDERKKGDAKAAARLNARPGLIKERNLLETLRGGEAGYKSAFNRGREDTKDFVSAKQYEDYADTTDDKKLPYALIQHYKSLATAPEKIAFQDKVIAASKYGDMKKIIDEIGFKGDSTLNDMAGARLYFEGARRISNQNRGAGAATRAVNQAAAGFFPHGSGGGAPNMEDEINNVTESFDDKTKAAIDARAQEISEQAEHLRLSPETNKEELQTRLADTLKNWQSVLKEGVDNLAPEQMTRVKALGNQTREMLEGSLDQSSASHQKLQGILHQIDTQNGNISTENAQSLAKMVENHSIALAAGTATSGATREQNQGNVKQILERSETAKQVVQSTANNISQLDPQSLDALAGAINNASDGNTKQLEAFLQQHQSAMNRIFGNPSSSVQEKALQDMASNIKSSLTEAISGRNKRSISSILRSGLEDMHKSLGRQTIDLNIPAATQAAAQPTAAVNATPQAAPASTVPPQPTPVTPSTNAAPGNPEVGPTSKETPPQNPAS